VDSGCRKSDNAEPPVNFILWLGFDNSQTGEKRKQKEEKSGYSEINNDFIYVFFHKNIFLDVCL